MNARTPGQTVRIIGGNWRGRKVSFGRDADIRPTPSRIRETLFNWLREKIVGARCLELYAGSGILSFEALSRGACHVTLVEQSRKVSDHLRRQLASFCPESGRFNCYNTTARRFLASQSGGPWDIVFLDPPFASDELPAIMDLLDQEADLADGAHIYIESGRPLDDASLPPAWTLHRQKRAGNVHYCLAILGR